MPATNEDLFSIPTQIQNKDGWVKHPLDELLRQQQNQSSTKTLRRESTTSNKANPTYRFIAAIMPAGDLQPNI